MWFEGKWVFVIGGCFGIGCGIVDVFLFEGVVVVVCGC